MTGFVGPIRRRNYGRGHGYVDALGAKVPSVTGITKGGVPKPALIGWAANFTAAYAVDHWDELSSLSPSARMYRLQQAWRDDLSAAAARGTRIHSYGPRLLNGEPVEVPDDLTDYVASYVRFLDHWDARPVIAEAVVVSHTYGYAGTLDLIGDLIDPAGFGETERWLLDSKSSRSGVYGDVALQLAGYRYCDVWVDDDGETPLPQVERTGVLHIRADGYDVVPVDAGPDQFQAFLAAKRVAAFTAVADELVGEPLLAPLYDEIEVVEAFA